MPSLWFVQLWVLSAMICETQIILCIYMNMLICYFTKNDPLKVNLAYFKWLKCELTKKYCHLVEKAGTTVNTLRPRQNRRHFTDDIFKCIFLNGNLWIPIKISLKFVFNGPINNIPAMVQIMAWCRSGDKPLSEPMMVGLPTHICVTRHQWVKNAYSYGVKMQSHVIFP